MWFSPRTLALWLLLLSPRVIDSLGFSNGGGGDSGDDSSGKTSSPGTRLGSRNQQQRILPCNDCLNLAGMEQEELLTVVGLGLFLILLLFCCCCHRWSLMDVLACVCLYEICCDRPVEGGFGDGYALC